VPPDDSAIDVLNDNDDISDVEVETRRRLDGNANHCDDNDVAPPRGDQLNKNESRALIDSDFVSQQRNANEVIAATSYKITNT